MQRGNKSGWALLAPSMIAMTACFAWAGPAAAQDVDEETVIVTGIRGSLERAMDIKREANGVVDAISAEDIGDFPDTNLAESLQRIAGVSINRVNGEGSEVTVRGFGGGFNLVTLNGRQMPTANIATVGGDQGTDFISGTSRSFDFSNLASEGVNGLQVYKTGRASVPSGGIGATINIDTVRPLDGEGLRGSFGVKAAHDTGNVYGEDITPELSGLLSWTSPNEMFGVSVFGSYQERDGSTRSATVNGWNIERYSAFVSNGRARGDDLGTVGVDESADITNAPGANELVSYPNDSRYHFGSTHRERTNAQITLQFRPIDTLTLTADYAFARNETEEQRMDQTNWFNRPFDTLIFEENPVISSTLFLQENISGVKDMGFEQQYRSTEDTLNSFGFNADWQVTDRFTLAFDAHRSTAEAGPNNPLGHSSTLVSIGAPVIAGHSLDFSTGVPVQRYEQNFTRPNGTTYSGFNDALRGNNNGVLDVGDLGSQQYRSIASNQEHTIDEIRIDAGWDFDVARLDFGVDYRQSEMQQTRVDTQQVLGDWGINNPGDVAAFAGSAIETFCLSCQFEDLEIGDAETAFRADATELASLLGAVYAVDRLPLNAVADPGNANAVTNRQDNTVAEDIFAAYAQISMDGEFMDRSTRLVAGLRYEDTQVESTSLVALPSNIVWVSDNDFTRQVSATLLPNAVEGSYSNVLPSFDFSIDLSDTLVGRVSFSKTIARADYGQLFAADVANAPPRPTALGGIPSGTAGNPNLLPLISDNFDVSLEWYYGDASFVSVGFYEKRVQNFVGTGQTTRTLYDLRDPSSGAAGSRSGDARTALTGISAEQSDVNLFTMTALIDNRATIADAVAEFQANRTSPTGPLNQTYVDSILAQYDITAEASDPFYQFQVTQPINNREARIYGFEMSGQHFFGETGFGLAGSFTTVNGDVEIDPGADPSVDQFALIGLSNTYNVTGIYENHGIAARISYNWRDEFLSQTNRGGGNRNPVFTEAFGQLDMAVSYDVTPALQISFEGINMLEEGQRTFGRDDSNVWFAQELDARFLLGARYRLN